MRYFKPAKITRIVPSEGGAAGTPNRAIIFASAACSAACLSLASAPVHALTIHPTFASSLTSQEQTTINNALGVYGQLFNNPVTVNIYFDSTSGTDGAGQSQSAVASQPYQIYTNMLANTASTSGNSVRQTAVANLQYGNGYNTAGASVIATTAALRALGFSGADGYLTSAGHFGGSYDGVITIDTAFFQTSVIQHETDEVLGIGGAGSVLGSGLNNGLNFGTVDLFRYASPHAASFTTSATATSYFSINGGVANIIGFNQNSSGDYGDWVSSPCFTQSWQVCSGAPSVALTTPEGVALQAIGYDVAAVPEPDPSIMMLMGFGLLGLISVRKRQASAFVAN